MHRVFISYHHKNDQWYKEELVRWGEQNGIFIDESVHVGDIPDDCKDEDIRIQIRDEYLRITSVTILLVGTHTWARKHIDWELYSSMRDSEKNKKSGLVVIMLPSTGCTHVYASHAGEKTDVFYNIPSYGWSPITTKVQCDNDYPYLPDRIIDQLLSPDAYVSIINWNDFYPYYPKKLEILINNAYDYRSVCKYDLSRPMRRRNLID